MTQIPINYLAVVIAAVASMVLGMVWYSQPLFGKMWMKGMGVTKESMAGVKKGMGKRYVIAFIGSLVMAYVLAHFVGYLSVQDAGTPAMQAMFQIVFWLWLGFIATVMLSAVLWENKPWSLYLINVLYQLVNLWVMGAVIVAMV